MKKENPTLLTVAEVAEIFRTNKKYVYDLINSGELDALKLGSIKINQDNLTDFLHKNIGNDLTNPYKVKPLVLNNWICIHKVSSIK